MQELIGFVKAIARARRCKSVARCAPSARRHLAPMMAGVLRIAPEWWCRRNCP